MQTMIERENFALRQLNLVQSPIPEDASALILNAPRFDLSRGEIDKILDYLDKGGRLIILVDYRVREINMVNEIMASYGMSFDMGIVMENDYSYNVSGIPFYTIPDLRDHDITNPMIQQRTPYVLSYTMGISELPQKRRSVELTPLLTTSYNSYLWIQNEESDSDAGIEIRGPIILGMAAMDPSWIDPNNPQPQARIVAIASGSLLEPMDYFGQIPGNLDLFMNAITWLENRPETLTVRSKSMFLLPMRISGFETILYGIIIVIVIPLAFFVAGFVIWLKRRHL